MIHSSGLKHKILAFLMAAVAFFSIGIGSAKWLADDGARNGVADPVEVQQSTVYVARQSNANTGTGYYSINSALQSVSSGNIYVLLDTPENAGKKFIVGDVTIKSGVNVFVLFDSSRTSLNDGRFMTASQTGTANFADSSAAGVASNMKNRLYMAPNSRLTIKSGGAMYIGAINYSNGGYTGVANAAYAEVVMGAGATIDCYGTLQSFGYIKEEAKNNGSRIIVRNGGTLLAPLAIYDYEGESVASDRNSAKSTPFYVIGVPNVQTRIHVEYGGYFDTSVHLTPLSSSRFVNVHMIAKQGVDAMLTVNDSSSYLVWKQTMSDARYSVANASRTTEIEVYGNGSINVLVISMSGISVSSQNFHIPLDFEYRFYIKKNANLSVAQKVRFMTGAKIIVEEGGVLECKSGADVFMDASRNTNVVTSSYGSGSYDSVPGEIQNSGTVYIRSGAKIAGKIVPGSDYQSGSFIIESGATLTNTVTDYKSGSTAYPVNGSLAGTVAVRNGTAPNFTYTTSGATWGAGRYNVYDSGSSLVWCLDGDYYRVSYLAGLNASIDSSAHMNDYLTPSSSARMSAVSSVHKKYFTLSSWKFGSNNYSPSAHVPLSSLTLPTGDYVPRILLFEAQYSASETERIVLRYTSSIPKTNGETSWLVVADYGDTIVLPNPTLNDANYSVPTWTHKTKQYEAGSSVTLDYFNFPELETDTTLAFDAMISGPSIPVWYNYNSQYSSISSSLYKNVVVGSYLDFPDYDSSGDLQNDYIFSSWSLDIDPSASSFKFGDKIKITANMANGSSRANMSPQYGLAATISFSVNNSSLASGSMGPYYVAQGAVFELPDPTFTKATGAVFANYTIAGSTYMPHDTVVISGNTTVTANYEAGVAINISQTTASGSYNSWEIAITRVSDGTVESATGTKTIYVKSGDKIYWANTSNISSVTLNGSALAAGTQSGAITSTATLVVTPTTKSSGCVMPDTLVTMADGSQKEIQYVRQGELIRVWNHETGELDVAPVTFTEKEEFDYFAVTTLTFSDGSSTRYSSEHGYFDVDLRQYVYFDDDNYLDYVGHNFLKVNSLTGAQSVVRLVSAQQSVEYTEIYSLPSYYHLNFFADNLLSMPGGIKGLFNIFELDENFKYDEIKKAADIARYGLFTLDDFGGLIDQETFNAYPAAYLKVSIGKGIMTEEDLMYLIERYGKYTQ